MMGETGHVCPVSGKLANLTHRGERPGGRLLGRDHAVSARDTENTLHEQPEHLDLTLAEQAAVHA
jgi:hypothetical protein